MPTTPNPKCKTHFHNDIHAVGKKLPINPLTCTIVERSNSRDENNPKHHHGVPQRVNNNYFLTHSSSQFKLKPAACQNTETTSTNSNQTSKCHLQGLSLISIANFNRFASKSKLPSSNKGHTILACRPFALHYHRCYSSFPRSIEHQNQT